MMALSYLDLLLCSIKTVLFITLSLKLVFPILQLPCDYDGPLVNFNSSLKTSGNSTVGIRAFPFSSLWTAILVTVIA